MKKVRLPTLPRIAVRLPRPRLPAAPSLPRISLSLPRLTPPSVRVPTLRPPSVHLPSVRLPRLGLPSITLPGLPRVAPSLVVATVLLVFGALAVGAIVERGSSQAPETGRESERRVLVISDQVTEDLCTPCHGKASDSIQTSDLRYAHGPHLEQGIECSSCHTEFPHSEGNTAVPMMETCFSCHNQSHPAVGVIAPGDCTFCHTQTMTGLPHSHTKEFINGGHGESTLQSGGLSCQDCHTDADFCVSCHQAKQAKPASHAGSAPKGDSVLATSSCGNCHAEFRRSFESLVSLPSAERSRGILTHRAHVLTETNAGITCSTCHEAAVAIESLELCYTCHDPEAASPASTLTGADLCRRCHPRTR